MSVKLIKRACHVLKPLIGGKAVTCIGETRCAPEACIWARWHMLPPDSPLRRSRTLTVKPKRR